MQKEIEAKFLNQNHDEIRKKLLELGAKCVHANKLMHRTTMDYPDRSLQSKGSWIRLREELSGDIELILKQVKDSKSIDGVFETAVGVSDYEKAKQFLLSIGLQIKSEQESKREVWELDGVEIMLDEWPWVPTYIEIEAGTEEKVKDVASKLGLNWSDAVFGAVTPVYATHYGISGPEFESLEISMRFNDSPPEQLTKYSK